MATYEQFMMRVNDLAFDDEYQGLSIREIHGLVYTEFGIDHGCQLELDEVIEHDPWVCFKCKQPVVAGFPDGDPATSNSECGLTLRFDGGYGEFIDHLGTKATMVLCHECAHALCDFLGVDPYNWHSHTYRKDWTGHTGWDLPHEREAR